MEHQQSLLQNAQQQHCCPIQAENDSDRLELDDEHSLHP